MRNPSSELPQNVSPARVSEHIQPSRPEDYVSVEPEDRSEFETQASSSLPNGCRTPTCEWPENKCLLLRPHVTVNVFNTAGSNACGSDVGNPGTECLETDNAAIADPGNGADEINSLKRQLAALSHKVEQLSLQRSARGVVIDGGVWNTVDIRHWSKPQSLTEGRVNFSKDFKSIPWVTTSINSLDVSNSANCRVRVYATAVDLKGFTIHADSWHKTEIFSCGVSWTAIGE